MGIPEGTLNLIPDISNIRAPGPNKCVGMCKQTRSWKTHALGTHYVHLYIHIYLNYYFYYINLCIFSIFYIIAPLTPIGRCRDCWYKVESLLATQSACSSTNGSLTVQFFGAMPPSHVQGWVLMHLDALVPWCLDLMSG